MSLQSAMFTGVSGLLNNGEAMNVIGNNIANVNTVGFKGGRTLFSDQLSQSIGNNSQVGKGVQLQTVQNLFTQGSSQNSESVTDLSIQGNSFFALKSPVTAAPVILQTDAYLSRAGAFHVDNTLTLVNPDGYQVLDTTGNPVVFVNTGTSPSTDFGKITKIEPNGVITYLATDGITQNYYNKVSTSVSAAAAGDPAAAGATANAAANAVAVTKAAENGTATGAADALVAAGLLTLATANTGIDAADTVADNKVNAANLLPSGTPAEIIARDRAVAEANAYKAAVTAVKVAASAAGVVPGATDATVIAAASAAAIANDSGAVAARALAVTAANAVASAANAANVAGATAADVARAAVAAAGNGVPLNAASASFVQGIAVVTAADPTALVKVGGSLFQSSGGAGVPATAFTLAGNKPNGTSDQVLSNTLEQSNVDMANEFVKMIVTQRAYSANSKTITTTDQMTQEVLNLIR